MHKFLIYLSVYFCLTCFVLSFSPSSEAGVQLRQWCESPGYGVSARAPTQYPEDFIYEYECEVPGGALNVNFTNCPGHGHHGDLYLQGNIHKVEPGIEPGTS
jgi:hypothetical protein